MNDFYHLFSATFHVLFCNLNWSEASLVISGPKSAQVERVWIVERVDMQAMRTRCTITVVGGARISQRQQSSREDMTRGSQSSHLHWLSLSSGNEHVSSYAMFGGTQAYRGTTTTSDTDAQHASVWREVILVTRRNKSNSLVTCYCFVDYVHLPLPTFCISTSNIYFLKF